MFNNTRFAINLSILVIVSIIICSFSSVESFARAKKAKKEETPKKAIKILEYKWGSGGMGMPGILRTITIENTGKYTYKDIQIEAEFFSRTDIPMGSLRATIKDKLEPGTTKTYKNLNFGLMHNALEKSELRIAVAKTVFAGPGSKINPSDLVFVKSWSWDGGRYSTEGILKEITLENRSDKNLKNVEILVEYFGGTIKRSYTRGYIQDMLPKGATKTFNNVNVSFRNPEAKSAIITVIGADVARMKKKRFKASMSNRIKGREGIDSDLEDGYEVSATAKRKRMLLSKRAVKNSEQSVEFLTEIPETDSEIGEEKVLSVRKITDAELAEAESLGAVEFVEVDDIDDFEEEPIPDQDIIIVDYKIKNTIPYTIGFIKEITLENISSITYGKIQLTVDFYSRTDNRPLGSARVVISDVLPPNAKRTYDNVRIGFLNIKPEVTVIRVVEAFALK